MIGLLWLASLRWKLPPTFVAPADHRSLLEWLKLEIAHPAVGLYGEFVSGIVLSSIVLSKLGHYVFVTFVKVLGSRFDLREEVAELLILPIIATLGFLPLFIYGAWLA